TIQPSACAARPGGELQTASRGASFPGWQERIESRAQVPRTIQRLSQHFELRGQRQPTEGHRTRGGPGREQNRFAGQRAANSRQTILPRVKKLLLPPQLAWPVEQTRVDQQFSVTLGEAKAEPPQVRRDIRQGTGNEWPARRSRLDSRQTKALLNR